MRKFVMLLLFEVLIVIAVSVVFKIVPIRLVAAGIAGSIFVLLGVVIFVMGLRESAFRHTFSFGVGCIHLFIIALPLMIVRFANSETPFDQLHLWGLPLPKIHMVSGIVYVALMISAVVDGFLLWRREKRLHASPEI